MKVSRVDHGSSKIVAAFSWRRHEIPAACLCHHASYGFRLFSCANIGFGNGQGGADTLIRLDADFMKAAAERGSQGYMSYYADDAAELPDGADMFRGKENIAKTMGFLDDKNNHLAWTPV